MKPLLLVLLVVFGTASTCKAAPSIISPPTITGESVVGHRLDAGGTLADEAADADLTLTWERSVEIGGYLEIPDAHDTTYVPVRADAGRRLRVHVVVETATGTDEGWSDPTEPVARGAGSGQRGEPLQMGAERDAPAVLARWSVRAGSTVLVSGQLPADQREAAASIVLDPTVAGYSTLESVLTADEQGHLSGAIAPSVNAVAWLVLDDGFGTPQRIRLGVVGVRPRIRLRLGAGRDGMDAQGRALVRDLALLPGSVVAPNQAGLHFTWEGILPGERRGTAVCRSGERVLSTTAGQLRGSCATRGAWSRARWRLVYDPGTSDLGSSPFLAATSAWVQPRLLQTQVPNVPNLPRAYANLRMWN